MKDGTHIVQKRKLKVQKSVSGKNVQMLLSCRYTASLFSPSIGQAPQILFLPHSRNSLKLSLSHFLLTLHCYNLLALDRIHLMKFYLIETASIGTAPLDEQQKFKHNVL